MLHGPFYRVGIFALTVAYQIAFDLIAGLYLKFGIKLSEFDFFPSLKN